MTSKYSEDKHRHKSGSCSHRDRSRSRSRSPRRKDEPIIKDTKIAIAKSKLQAVGIQMKLGSAQKPGNQIKPKMTVASVFNQDSDEEPEVMPPEARMRMRNIGRDTPTSAGPNSFGKTKHGFCDAKKVFEKSLKEAMDNASESSK